MGKVEIIGKKYTNRQGLIYTVNKEVSHKNTETYFEICFEKTGTKKISEKRAILRGSVFDQFNPHKYGVGFIGNASCRVYNKKAYKKWDSMLSRCYNNKNIQFKNYGGSGVVVDSRWHCFEFFLDDLVHLGGWNEELFTSGKLELDKDYLIAGNKTYSKNTCILISKYENQQLLPSRMKRFKAISPSGEIFYSMNIMKFARENNLTESSIRKVLGGKIKKHKGWVFYYANQDKNN